jgi:hypothetical protein
VGVGEREEGSQKDIQKRSEDRSLRVDPTVYEGRLSPGTPTSTNPKHYGSCNSEQNESRTPIQMPGGHFVTVAYI